MDKKLADCLALVRSGAPGAFPELAQQYQPLALSLVDKILPKMPPANGLGREDLIQEANIALYRAATTYDASQTKVTFGLYAKICIRNRLISALRKQRRSAKKYSSATKPSVKANRMPDSEATKIQLDGLLTKYEEQVLNLRLSGYSYKEIAKILKTDPKSIDNALCRIRKKIRISQNGSE